MKNKRLTAIATALIMLFAMIPCAPVIAQTGTGGLTLDTDANGGYEGDYVLIYNPSTDSYGGYSTGNMTGLIETEADPYAKGTDSSNEDGMFIIDVDAQIEQENLTRPKAEPLPDLRTSYNVGDTRNFTISYYSPGSSTISFKCIAKGDHCYVWTPAQNSSNYYPLDVINPDFAQMVADEFDAKYPLMNSSFGDHSNGSQGDGRIHLMYYNIDDGWNINVTTGYVAGYFSSGDFSTNSLPMIHIDTYPGVYYVNAQGEERIRITNTYSVFCHEYQHLINYSQTGGMDTWLNECMSAAAEEICYPGSSVVSRIQSWENYYYSDNGDWLTPPTEFEYSPEYELHNGFSMYDWDSYMEYILPLYSQVSLFSQYLFTHYGNTIFKEITQRYSTYGSINAISNATGMQTSELVKNFRIAMIANDPVAFDGLYGFTPQSGYDPEEYHGVVNPYDLLSPVIFTGNSCTISGGGAIAVKPIGGVYVPPADADSRLVYIGISRNIHTDPVALDGMELDPEALTVYEGSASTIRIIRTPINANDYDVEWESSDPSVAAVSGSARSASVQGVSLGHATVTCRATDRSSGRTYTASTMVSVLHFPTIDEALNVPGGSLTFRGVTSYQWEVNVDHEGRVCANSTNQGVSSSTSSIQTTIDMEAGETLSFDWAVSSEGGFDKLIFYVNGSNTVNINGSVSFTTYTYTAPSAGSYTFKWSYEKDYSVNTGDDTGYLDNVAYSGDPAAGILLGDVNMDGTVDASDALLVLRYSMELIDLTDEQLLRADYNCNGNVSADDALLILRNVL